MSIEKGVYHPLDVERIKKDTCWVRAFYKHSQENSDKTVNMINEVLIWRKEFNANGKDLNITLIKLKISNN